MTNLLLTVALVPVAVAAAAILPLLAFVLLFLTGAALMCYIDPSNLGRH